jgi:hypothetical protein
VRTEEELRAALSRMDIRYAKAVERPGCPKAYLNGLYVTTETLRWVLDEQLAGLFEHPYADTLEGRS